MSWTPLGPRFVFAPMNQSFHRISRRNELDEQGIVAGVTIDPNDPGTIYTVHRPTNGGVGLYRSSSAGTPDEHGAFCRHGSGAFPVRGLGAIANASRQGAGCLCSIRCSILCSMFDPQVEH